MGKKWKPIERTKTIKLKLPITAAERIYLSQLISVYPKVCNIISKHVYNKKIVNREILLKELYPRLKQKYEIDRTTAKSAIKSVILKYKEREKKHKKRKYIRFKKKEHYFHWGLTYLITEEQFFISGLGGQIKCIPVNYNKYFGVFDGQFFGPATLKRHLFSYYLVVPITIMTNDNTSIGEKILSDFLLWILWRPMKKRFLQK